jgi:hypothetical protein
MKWHPAVQQKPKSSLCTTKDGQAGLYQLIPNLLKTHKNKPYIKGCQFFGLSDRMTSRHPITFSRVMADLWNHLRNPIHPVIFSPNKAESRSHPMKGIHRMTHLLF